MRIAGASCLMLWVLSSCSSIEANSDFDPDADFSSYRTFAMAPPPKEGPAAMPGYSDLGGRSINRKIAAHLTERGLTEVDENEADLVVGFELAGERRSEVRSTPGASISMYNDWYGVGWYDRDVYTVNYVVGTLIVDAFERRAERLVWHAWSSVSLYSQKDAEKRGDQVIAAVMDRFPRPVEPAEGAR